MLKDTSKNEYFDNSIPHRVFNLGNNMPEKLKDFFKHYRRKVRKESSRKFSANATG